jgi:hypothetical protein
VSVKGWSVIFKGPRFLAETLQAILEANDIRAEVFGDTAYGVGVNFTDARLLVPDEQAVRAGRLIQEAEESPVEPEEEGEETSEEDV